MPMITVEMKKEYLSNLLEKHISGEWGSDGDKIPVIRSTNFTMDGILDLSDVKFRDIEDSKIAKKKLQKGDILIEKSGGSLDQPVGRVVFFDEDGDYLFSNFTSALRPKSKKVFPKYLNYILLSAYKGNVTSYFQNRTTGIINLQLTRYVNELQIPLPPLPIQQKIATALDKADAIRKRSQQILAKYDQLAQSVFLEMFGDPVKNEKGWDIMELEKVCEHIIDCPHSTPDYVDYPTEYPCIRTSELKNGSIDWSKMKYLDANGYEERTRRLKPAEGDIIYGREGSFGEACIVPRNCFMSLGQRVMLFRPKKELMNSTYLHSIIRSKGVYHQALKVTSGSTVGHINVKDIKKFKLTVPPINFQNQFASVVKQIEKQKAQTQMELNQAEELYQSLLQKAFTGELFSETHSNELPNA
jgi:type I restriction enzyme S subunit